jgi:O-antigen/teichoic acid export membrane protein
MRLRRGRRLLADDTLSQRASLNMFAAILDYGARIVVGLIVQPILVSRLGDLVFGVYQTLGRLVGYATPAGGRPSQALKWTIARHQHSTEYEEKRLQVGSALAVWLIFLPPLAVVGGILAWISPLVLGLPDSMHTTVRIAAGLLVADMILLSLLTIPQSVVEGENLGYKRMGVSALVVLGGGGLMVTMAEVGAGLIGVVSAIVTTTILTGLLFLWVARQQIPWFGMARPSMRVMRGFLQLSGWFLLWNLVMQLLRASDFVVLGIAASPQDVTVYTLVRYVPEAIFSVVAIIISAIMPGLGGVIGAGETGRAASVRSETMTVTWLLATASGAAFLLIHESFLSLWVGAEYLPGQLTTLLIVVMVLQFAFIRNDASIIDLTLELRGKVLLGLLSAAVSIGLAVLFLLAWDLGIAGLALGFIAGRGIMSIAYPWSVCRALGLSPLAQLRGAVRPICVSAALFALALAIAPATDVGSWPLLICLVAGSVAVFGGMSYFLGLSARRRTRVSGRVRRVIGR